MFSSKSNKASIAPVKEKTVKRDMTIDCLLSARAHLEGDLTFEGGLRVDATVKGNITGKPNQPSMVVISEQGSVTGQIRASHIVVNGTVTGPVYATDLLELQNHARVFGDIHYASLEMSQGAVVEGSLHHMKDQAIAEGVASFPHISVESTSD